MSCVPSDSSFQSKLSSFDRPAYPMAFAIVRTARDLHWRIPKRGFPPHGAWTWKFGKPPAGSDLLVGELRTAPKREFRSPTPLRIGESIKAGSLS